MNRALLTAAMTCVLGGWTDRPGASPRARDFLDNEPRWSAVGEGLVPGNCFGSSMALGDVDGDGHKDLIVAAPPCSWTPNPGQGQVVVYRGTDTFFSSTPTVVATLNWYNPLPRTGRSMVVSTGNVNGDGFADVMVRAQAGVLVFLGRPQLGTVFNQPFFRGPGSGTFSGGMLVDMNGDGLDDVISQRGAIASTFLSTPGGPQPFTYAGYIFSGELFRAGDTNGDGAQDLLVRFAPYSPEEQTLLYRGCPAGVASCFGGVETAPAWTVSGSVVGTLPDRNGDGFSEVFRGDFIGGRVTLNYSDPLTGAPSETPVWAALGDPLFPGLARTVVALGDVNGDGQATEFAISSIGRQYLFVPPRDGISAELRPTWTWSAHEDPLAARTPAYNRLPLVPAGDLDHDGFDDVLMSVPPPNEFAPSSTLGRVVVLGGGKVLASVTGPYLPEQRTGGLTPGGKPDITVDGDVLARSAHIERRYFSETSCEVQERCVNAPGTRRLLRFSASIVNLGTGSAYIPSPDDAPDLYHFDACHKHEHLEGFASYELHDTQSQLVATGRKQGFQLIDFQPYRLGAALPTDYYPAMGISPGWADIYTSDLPCQWLDVTDVPDGTYTLRVAVDENNLIDEQDERPNHADVKLHIHGDMVQVTPVGQPGLER